MRQQVCKNKSWKKRVAAAGMAICMACTMPFSVQAENVTEEYNVQEDYSTESAAENVSDEKSEVQSYDIETAQTVNQEDSAAQEPSKEEVQLSLQLVAVENTDTTTPNLTLDQADKLSENITVKKSDSNTIIEVKYGEGLILLSNVKPEEYANCEVKLITTSGWDLTKPVKVGGTTEVAGKEYSFLGLGNDGYPYAGMFGLDNSTAATQYSISTTRPLFNALSVKATLNNTIPFSIAESASSTKEPLLAKTLKAAGSGDGTEENSVLNCNIELRNLNADKITDAAIGGLIGTMEGKTRADITFTNQLTSDLTISGTDHVGLFCNTMQAGSYLTATLKNGAGKISVAATESGKDAGGFVGHMETDDSLTIAGTSVSSVASSSGNAGGIVGSSIDGSVTVKASEQDTNTNIFQFADSITLSAGSDKAAGGLIGEYNITKSIVNPSISFDLSRYKFNTVNISGGKNVGGLFGELKNEGVSNSNDGTGISSISISSASTDSSTNNVNVNVSDTASVTNYGGLIGSYSAQNMAGSLSISGNIDVKSIGGSKAESSYGGVIGEISGNSYVVMENVAVSTADMKFSGKASFGGLVGKMNNGFLNAGNVKLVTADNFDLAGYDKNTADDVEGRGGLVGYLVKGVLRLHGTTDLRGQKITAAYNHVGQIVGNNGSGLVYALGNGNTLPENKEGWSLIRYNGADRSGSDIGNWGAVVRLGDKLTEADGGSLTFDQQAHTVTVNNGNDGTIKDTNAFAAYALAFDLSSAYTNDANSALKFQSTVKPTDNQTVTLTGDIDLTGTGILGIGKDSTEKNENVQTFTGTFNGNSQTITLDIGSVYGNGILAENNSTPNAAGQLYTRRKDPKNAHYSLALIPFSKDATIQNVTVAGNINCKVPSTVDQETKESSPALVSGVVGLASGTTTFENVTVTAKSVVSEESNDAKKLQVWQGGFIGKCDGSILNFKNCTWGSSLTDERSTDNQRIGGLAAEVMGGCTVTVEGCTLSGSITSKAGANASVGGLIAVSRGENQKENAAKTTINISKLNVNGANIIAEAANETSGGLLGYLWQNTDVVFATAGSTGNADAGTSAAQSGVTISGSTLNAKTAQFGGLVYQATGYWNATAKDSIIFTAASDNASDTQQTGTNSNIFTGKSVQDTPSGLIVGTGLITREYKENDEDKKTVESALYLEAGTWGDAADAAYKINSGAVTLNIDSSDCFDELVGITKFNDAGNSNAVVSLAVRENNGSAAKIDIGDKLNTYTGQIDNKNYKNDKTRYYYNLDSYRKSNLALNLDSVSIPENLVLWSVAQYAAPNIRGCFRQGDRTDVNITGVIDLTGYSYYPVTPIGAVNLGTNQGNTTSLIFDYDGMNEKENENKKLSDSDHQHYLMQHGLFYNAYRNIAVKNTFFSGTVGKEPTEKDRTTYNSGALIYGSVVGDPVNYIVGITLNKVTLAGIRVTDVDNNVTYAPLLINQMEKAVKLTVDTLSTGEGYKDSDKTVYAATSLIGNVGNNKATKLTLSFSNIALDGRVAADKANAASVYNNGKVQVEYNTTHTIFTKATLLESFMYSSEGSGTYNFNSTDKMVTYGVELTNTGSTGRNPDKQYQYYDGEIYITDEKDKSADESYVKSRYASNNFIRYVYTQQNIDNNKYELDINQKTSGLLEGCGTYGDPYIIEDAHQLSSLAAYIEKPESVKKFQAVFNSKVLSEKKQTAESYHIAASTTDNTNNQDICYTWDGSTWKQDTQENKEIDRDTATKYLLNAYYKINKDITLSAESFSGLGTKDNPFSGVIIGAQNIDVKIIGTNSNKDSFGGLIAYSRGSVVKDLKVDYTSATIQMQADTLPGTTKNPFFGGVVGYCMGGDTIIDNVSVNYEANSVTFSSGNYEYMIAAGGYVGLVGGATHVTEDSDYEKTGGGVVFRNMNNTKNNFAATCSDAAASNKTVNMVDKDGATDGKTTSDGGKYFYRNPYVGRVLDGYACAENCTVDNTDKNYTIPNLQAGTTDLTVSENSGDASVLDVTVTSAQALWLLSAIVNSGAGAMDSTGSYTDVPDNKKEAQVVDAYQYGKPRTASYDGIGEVATDVAAKLADEAYWGGNASTAESNDAKDRVSYLVKNYTTDTTAARLAGKSSTADTNNQVKLIFSADSIDMTSYGNGFRGIGSSYGENKKVEKDTDCSISKVYRRNLLVKSINEGRAKETNIKLDINQNDYLTEYSNGSWRNQGAGLFVDFHFTVGCTVSNLRISGNVKLGLFDDQGTLTHVTTRTDGLQIGVGGFAARTANSSGKVTFNNFNLQDINVYGGTMTGGAIGYVDGYNTKAARTVTFENWTINNENVSKWVNKKGSTGGLVGWYIGYGTLTINGINTETKNVQKLNASMYIENNDPDGAIGGLVGACEQSSVNVENIKAVNLKVYGRNVKNIGGFIASSTGGTVNIKNYINNCELSEITMNLDQSINSKDSYMGGLIGNHNKEVSISNVTITQSTFFGQRFVGGFTGQSTANITISDCQENNVNIKAATNWTGGFIGYLSQTATFKNCQANKVNILGLYAGGLVGVIAGNIKASNMDLSSMRIVTTKNNGSYAGLIAGNTASKNTNSINGYNILADSCKTGYSNVSDVSKLQTAKLEPISTSGLWIGNNGTKTTTKLVAVAAKGDVFPQKDIGTDSANATIIYADKTAEQAYKPTESTAKPSSSANPWLDVNPKSNVPFADGTVMTGNAVGMQTAESSAKGEIARAILSELNDVAPALDYYWNLADNKNEFVKFLDSTNDAYITTYMAEESATTEVDKKYDFPILVVNNSAEVDAMLWNYIAAMTNVKNGDTVKKQIKSITATSYKWDTTKNNFNAQESASLKVSETKKITIVPNAYDNQNSQFTLLDVTYADPTDTNEQRSFHLYIPVFVKKVLYISFKTRFIAGTDYCAADYPMNDNATNHYATAGFNEPLTAYIEYSYEKETDWQSMLDNGENLLWYYDKVLDLAFISTEESEKKLLPTGTRLTLVDRQTMQYYTYTTTENEDFHNFNLSNLQLPTAESSTASEDNNFKPVYICDLLGLTATQADEPDAAKTYYVKVDSKDTATVRVGNDYYRKAEEKDKDATKYSIAISKDSSSEQEARKESYFLTIQVPASKEYSVINNRLNYSEIKRNEGTLPAVIKSEKEQSGSAYVIYDGVSQNFTISTSRIHNGNIMGDTAMEDSDSIKINLESKLKLTEAGIGRFDKLGPSEVYHQFTINLKKYLQRKAEEYDVIGTEMVNYTYTFKNANGTEIYTKTGKISDAAGKDILSLQYGSKDLKKALENAKDDDTAITVTAEITLTYAGSDKFPVRNTADSSDDSGICVVGVSRIANTQTQLPITENKLTRDDKNRYYSTNPSKAKLTYSAVDQTAMGDTTQQLGINPSDTVNPADIIYTKADYDYSNVDETILVKANSISYKMELFQKNDSGLYDETNPLIIQSYLQNIVKESSAAQESAALRSSANDNYICWNENFVQSDSRHQIARFQYAPLTGEAFEEAGYTYANYRVRVTVVLLDEAGKELEGTKATDYIIYTNARIHQEIIMGQN